MDNAIDSANVLAVLPTWFWTAVAFAFGANVGSFLNVVIARVPFDESVVWPPSHCRACGTGIRPLRNLPIVSWFLLRGRCEACLAPFSFRYAFIELLFGLACAFAVYRHGPSLPAVQEMVLVGFCICLAAIDLDHWLLPHVLTRSGMVVGLLFGLAQSRELFLDRVMGAAIGYAALVLIGFVAERVAGQEAVGGGDPWLLGMLGAFLGIHSLFPIVLLASVQGSIIGGVMLATRRRRERATQAPAQAALPPAGAAGANAGEASTASAATDGHEGAHDEDDWVPPATGVPFGPFLVLGGLEFHYFAALRSVLVLPF